MVGLDFQGRGVFRSDEVWAELAHPELRRLVLPIALRVYRHSCAQLLAAIPAVFEARTNPQILATRHFWEAREDDARAAPHRLEAKTQTLAGVPPKVYVVDEPNLQLRTQGET